jgi:uncharacterized protein YecE (DUF72 family)
MQWHIGCSGFHYHHWKEIFYPEGLPQRKWFEYYCENFNTLELNVTFYRFPTPMMYKSWHARSPATFSFSVKAPRLITHFKKFRDVKSLMNDFYKITSKGLKEKLGCILFQLPPNLLYSEEKMHEITGNLCNSFTNAIEFRHKSWWNENTYKHLTEKNITFCGISHPLFPDDVVKTSSVMYYRFHGKPQLYRSQYQARTLNSFYQKLQEDENLKSAFIYFNNDGNASAIRNAKQLSRIAETDYKTAIH